VTRYLLDSNATKAVPSPVLIEWMADQPDKSLFMPRSRLPKSSEASSKSRLARSAGS
jgi:hypothetical protein